MHVTRALFHSEVYTKFKYNYFNYLINVLMYVIVSRKRDLVMCLYR